MNWISINDRLPKITKHKCSLPKNNTLSENYWFQSSNVLVYSTMHSPNLDHTKDPEYWDYLIGHLYSKESKEKAHWCERMGESLDGITHWMHLPEKP